MKRKHFYWVLGALLTLLAVSVLLYGVQHYRLRAAVMRVEAKGGSFGPSSILEHDYIPTPQNVRDVSFSGEPLTDEELASLMDELAYFPKLKSVDLAGTDVTDSCLELLDQIPELRTVVVANTGVTLEAIERFKMS